MNPNPVRYVLPLFLFSCFATPAHGGELPQGETVLVSQNDDGICANDDSYGGAIAGNGRFVAYESQADNLVAGDLGGHSDVFLCDLKKGTTVLISRSLGGATGNGESHTPSVSKNGRFITFQSTATDLVASDSNGLADIFVRDKKSSKTERVSVGALGVQSNGASQAPRISGNGRFVAFASTATNLVTGDINGKIDVFVHDRATGVTERVSVGGAGTGGVEADGISLTPAISANGRFVAFWSNAKNLDLSTTSGVFVHDRQQGTTTRVSFSSSGIPHALTYPDSLSISANGNLVTFAAAGAGTTLDDTSPHWDVFVRDVKNGTTEIVSLGEAGAAANADCISHAISGNGRFVLFSSPATTLVATDTTAFSDVFVRDRKNDVTTRVSVGVTGGGGNKDAYLGGISHDGRIVALESPATNLVSTTTNQSQTFARRW